MYNLFLFLNEKCTVSMEDLAWYNISFNLKVILSLHCVSRLFK